MGGETNFHDLIRNFNFYKNSEEVPLEKAGTILIVDSIPDLSDVNGLINEQFYKEFEKKFSFKLK
jgi:hypothetical protein